MNTVNLRPLSRVVMLFACVFPTLGTAQPAAAPPNWPQFRGPNASGVAADAKPPTRIGPETGVLWKTKVPWSPSSPCIWADRIFIATFDEGHLETRCYDRLDGALLWKQGVTPTELEIFHRTDGSPAASTPATDGKHVVSYFGSFGLVCYDFSGQELWRHPMPVAQTGGSFGTGTSPIIAGRAAILQRDVRQNSMLLALDVATGKQLWESPRPEATGSYGVPIVWNNEGAKEIVTAGSAQLNGYALESGKLRWSIKGLTAMSCTTPVVGDDHLYYGAWCPGGADQPWPEWSEFRQQHDKNGDGEIALGEFSEASRDFYRGLDIDANGTVSETDWKLLEKTAKRARNILIAVKPGGEGDISKSHIDWTVTKGLPYVPSPLYYKGRVYIIRDLGILSSLDAATGKPYYSRARLKARGSYYASPVAADDRIYLTSLLGEVTVIKAGGDAPEVLHEADFEERIFASPALVEDKLYLRTKSTLYAFGPEDAAKPGQ